MVLHLQLDYSISNHLILHTVSQVLMTNKPTAEKDTETIWKMNLLQDLQFTYLNIVLLYSCWDDFRSKVI